MNHDLNFRPRRENGEPAMDARNSEATLEQLSEMVDQIRTHVTRVQRRLDRAERNHASLMRYMQTLWVLAGLVIVGFGVVGWFGIPIVMGQRAPAKDLPAIQTALSNPVPGKPDNVPAVPTASPAAAEPPPPDPGRADAGKADVHSEVPAVHRDAAADLPADDVRRQRVDFQLHNNQTEQVAPGIYLTIKDADVEHQQVDGWLQIAKDGRIVWIRGQGAEKTLSFASQSGSHPSYVIFTRIDSRGVSGYFMLPA
jgi:hypothetical protein